MCIRDRLSAESLGALVALFDRTVGLYAELININAYHQPGVEAGKIAAAAVLELQQRIVEHIGQASKPQTAGEIAVAVDRPDEVETVFQVLEHLAANGRAGVVMKPADSPDRATFCRE